MDAARLRVGCAQDCQMESASLGKAELFVERNRARIVWENMENRRLRLRLKLLGESRHQNDRITFAAMIGVDTDGADLDETAEPHPFAGHRRERTLDAYANVLAEFDRTRTEWAGARPSSEIQHIGDVACAEHNVLKL
jgi:hypothetical protein